MISGVHWSKLKYQCPMDVEDIIKIAKEMEININSINKQLKGPNYVFDVSSKLKVLIRNLTALFYEDGFISNQENKEANQADKRVLIKLIENMSRLVGRLDDLEAELYDKSPLMNYNIVRPFISEIESILYGDIYYVFKRAIDKGFKNKREFLYNVWEISVNNAGIFGGEVRLRKGVKKITENITQPGIAREALSQEGQKKLSDEYIANELKVLESFGKSK